MACSNDDDDADDQFRHTFVGETGSVDSRREHRPERPARR